MATAKGKRQLVTPKGNRRFVRRDSKGQLSEVDDAARSLTQDRRKRARTAAKPGEGDKGDRRK